MNKCLSLFPLLLMLSMPSILFGQKAADYQFRREIKGVDAQWHALSLTNELFDKMNYQTSDVKILGFNEEGDTMEVPYINSIEGELIVKRELTYQLQERNDEKDVHHFTFKADTVDEVNNVRLYFNERNYDWRIDVSSSENGKDWVSLVKDFRILSVKSVLTRYNLNRVEFPKGTYPYLKLSVHCDQYPYLNKTKFTIYEISGGSLRDYEIVETKTTHGDSKKTTLHEIKLRDKVPVDQIAIFLPEKGDFFRKIAVRHFFDSVETGNGIQAQYRKLYQGTLTSVEDNEFYFDRALMQHIRIEIENGPNPPFELGKVVVSGFDQRLVARFPKAPGFRYFLYYGMEARPKAPSYGLDPKKVPAGITPLILGEEEPALREADKNPTDLFSNKWILGFLVLVAIVVAGGAIKKLKKS